MAKYTWVDIGSSFLPGEIIAAFLFAQLRGLTTIQRRREKIWMRYDRELADWSARWGIRRPVIPSNCTHPYHMYYLLMPSAREQTAIIRHLQGGGVCAVFHYQPLNRSPFAKKFKIRSTCCPVAERVSQRIVRLPFYSGMTPREQGFVLERLLRYRRP